jgi:8-oxo-dGTP diphosphatase
MTNSLNHAVKALIYRDDQRILLQQRDFNPDIIFQGYWTFFGGQVELGETLRGALERELKEELGCIPGRVGDELFQWEWKGELPMCNHCLPVNLEVGEDMLILNEGLAMKWFLFEELHEGLPLVPGIIENLHNIEAFLKKIFSSIK